MLIAAATPPSLGRSVSSARRADRIRKADAQPRPGGAERGPRSVVADQNGNRLATACLVWLVLDQQTV
jgi:hypothetical protein